MKSREREAELRRLGRTLGSGSGDGGRLGRTSRRAGVTSCTSILSVSSRSLTRELVLVEAVGRLETSRLPSSGCSRTTFASRSEFLLARRRRGLGMERSRGKSRSSRGAARSMAAKRDCSQSTNVSILLQDNRN